MQSNLTLVFLWQRGLGSINKYKKTGFTIDAHFCHLTTGFSAKSHEVLIEV